MFRSRFSDIVFGVRGFGAFMISLRSVPKEYLIDYPEKKRDPDEDVELLHPRILFLSRRQGNEVYFLLLFRKPLHSN